MFGGHEYVGVMVLLCIIASIRPCHGEAQCPELKDAKKFTIGHVCYQYVEHYDGNEVSFNVASNDCRSRSGNLVTIKDSATQTALVNYLGIVSDNDIILMGLRKQDNEWKWVTGQTAGYTNWGSSQTVGDCARLRLQHNGTWEQYSCASEKWSYAYVCEYGSNSSKNPIAYLWSTLVAVSMAILLTLRH